MTGDMIVPVAVRREGSSIRSAPYCDREITHNDGARTAASPPAKEEARGLAAVAQNTLSDTARDFLLRPRLSETETVKS